MGISGDPRYELGAVLPVAGPLKTPCKAEEMLICALDDPDEDVLEEFLLLVSARDEAVFASTGEAAVDATCDSAVPDLFLG